MYEAHLMDGLCEIEPPVCFDTRPSAVTFNGIRDGVCVSGARVWKRIGGRLVDFCDIRVPVKCEVTAKTVCVVLTDIHYGKEI